MRPATAKSRAAITPCENSGPQKQKREDPVLECRRELNLGEPMQVESVGPSRYVDRDDTDQSERPTEEGIKRQLHRAVFLVRRTPDRDEEVFRHNDQLVEDEEEKQVGAEENAVGSAHDQEQPEKELVRPLFDVPGK